MPAPACLQLPPECVEMPCPHSPLSLGHLSKLAAWPQVLDIHMLMVIAVAGAIALGEFTEAATVVVLFSLSDFLEGRCSGQVRGLCDKSIEGAACGGGKRGWDPTIEWG